MARHEADPMGAITVRQARELLADIEALAYNDEREAYGIIGRTGFIVAELVRLLDGEGPRK
ncbi:hypothetical protein OG539_16430 [Actinacidiphila glaucinigra]|uniref:hypothetical protein n=1 Tax=Actinacidiphila glaucinigra TaxID=235986 RepID=UPI003243FD83